MRRLYKHLPKLPGLIIILLVFQNIILSPVNIGGDLSLLSLQELQANYACYPTIWFNHLNNGFGTSAAFPLLWAPWEWFFANLSFLVANPELIQKIRLIIPIALAYFSINLFLSRRINNQISRQLVTVFFVCNSYFIMLIDGGQLGIAKAYALTPLLYHILQNWLTALAQSSRRLQFTNTLLLTFLLSLSIIIDSRLLIILSPLLLTLIFFEVSTKRPTLPYLANIIGYGSLTILLLCILNLPFILTSRQLAALGLTNQLNVSAQQVTQYFSFTTFTHALTLTQPHYPDNLFGKVNPINPLALIITLYIFASLKLNGQTRTQVFALLVLLYAFLAKGSNPPFADIYIYLYSTVPGMGLLRDSSKFFTPLIFLSSYLIALTLDATLKNTKQPAIKFGAIAVFCSLMIYMWSPTLLANLHGTLRHQEQPEAYNQLQNILESDQSFARVLWIPGKEGNGYSSTLHPPVNLKELTQGQYCINTLCQRTPIYPLGHQFTREDLSQEIDQQMQIFTSDTLETVWQDLAIGYIVLIPDYQQKQYLFDYQFDQSIYQEYKNKLAQLESFEKILDYQNLLVYKATFPTPIIKSDGQELSFQQQSPTQYQLHWPGGEGTIIMSQSWNPNWTLVNNKGLKISNSQKTNNGHISFAIGNSPGTYTIYFRPQQTVNAIWYYILTAHGLLIVVCFCYIFLNKHVFSKARS